MKKKRVYWGGIILLLGTALALLAGCGGGGGGGGGTAATTADVSGVWTIVETSGDNTCEEPVGVQDTYEVTVTQTGDALTVVTPFGTFTGSISGDVISWTGSFPEDGGTTTITLMNLTVASDGLSFSGSADWTWTDGTFSCSGSMLIDGSQGTAPPPAGLDVSGVWTVYEVSGANTCGDPVGVQSPNYAVTFTQTGSDLTVVNPVGTFSGTLSGDVISWTGSYAEEGGITTLTSMSLTVDSSGDNFTGPVNWSWSDGSFSCTGTTTATGSR